MAQRLWPLAVSRSFILNLDKSVLSLEMSMPKTCSNLIPHPSESSESFTVFQAAPNDCISTALKAHRANWRYSIVPSCPSQLSTISFGGLRAFADCFGGGAVMQLARAYPDPGIAGLKGDKTLQTFSGLHPFHPPGHPKALCAWQDPSKEGWTIIEKILSLSPLPLWHFWQCQVGMQSSCNRLWLAMRLTPSTMIFTVWVSYSMSSIVQKASHWKGLHITSWACLRSNANDMLEITLQVLFHSMAPSLPRRQETGTSHKATLSLLPSTTDMWTPLTMHPSLQQSRFLLYSLHCNKSEETCVEDQIRVRTFIHRAHSVKNLLWAPIPL